MVTLIDERLEQLQAWARGQSACAIHFSYYTHKPAPDVIFVQGTGWVDAPVAEDEIHAFVHVAQIFKKIKSVFLKC